MEFELFAKDSDAITLSPKLREDYDTHLRPQFTCL